MHRLFVAIRPPEHIRDLLIDAMDDSPELRWVGDDNLHLTLRFIGEVERPLAKDIGAALDRIRAAPFELRIAGLGMFERRNGGALWAGVEPRGRSRRSPRRSSAPAVRRPGSRAPRLSPPRDARSLKAATRARGARLRRAPPKPRLATVQGGSLRPVRKPPVRHGAHYEEVASYPLLSLTRFAIRKHLRHRKHCLSGGGWP